MADFIITVNIKEGDKRKETLLVHERISDSPALVDKATLSKFHMSYDPLVFSEDEIQDVVSNIHNELEESGYEFDIEVVELKNDEQ